MIISEPRHWLDIDIDMKDSQSKRIIINYSSNNKDRYKVDNNDNQCR